MLDMIQLTNCVFFVEFQYHIRSTIFLIGELMLSKKILKLNKKVIGMWEIFTSFGLIWTAPAQDTECETGVGYKTGILLFSQIAVSPIELTITIFHCSPYSNTFDKIQKLKKINNWFNNYLNCWSKCVPVMFSIVFAEENVKWRSGVGNCSKPACVFLGTLEMKRPGPSAIATSTNSLFSCKYPILQACTEVLYFILTGKEYLLTLNVFLSKISLIISP